MKIGILGDIYSGDISEGNNVSKNLIDDYSKSTILPLLNDLDCVIGNLEAPITNSENSIKKTGPAIKHSEEVLELLKKSNIKFVTLANNHLFDYGKEGISETLAQCSKNNIQTVGGGIDNGQIEKALVIEQNNKKIGIINAAENEFNTIELDSNHVGSNSLELIKLYYQIQKIKNSVDYLIMIFHGGHEEYHYPSPRIKKLYRYFIDVGCDAVIAHHPHVIQGFENYKQKPIYYSLGNFFFPSLAKDKSNQLGYIVVLEFNDNIIESKPIAYNQCVNSAQVNILVGEEKSNFEKKLNELSDAISNDSELENKWNEFVEFREIAFLQSLIPLHKKIAYRFFKFPLLQKFLPETYYLKILNLIRCESHKDVLVGSLMNKMKS